MSLHLKYSHYKPSLLVRYCSHGNRIAIIYGNVIKPYNFHIN
uniref:Uncharacterized protein n=1 Tax=Arundo donax TaxID=35708 RepID=A0A0A9GR02_ARUDO